MGRPPTRSDLKSEKLCSSFKIRDNETKNIENKQPFPDSAGLIVSQDLGLNL